MKCSLLTEGKAMKMDKYTGLYEVTKPPPTPWSTATMVKRAFEDKVIMAEEKNLILKFIGVSYCT